MWIFPRANGSSIIRKRFESEVKCIGPFRINAVLCEEMATRLQTVKNSENLTASVTIFLGKSTLSPCSAILGMQPTQDTCPDPLLLVQSEYTSA
mmetsp:Transcript_24681/g.72206  ORF Transcript_24681/g.72206 Transcript_24681/m.72206 type:complete len:94 (-) Transcript_24681:3080-3361(-)